MTSTFIELEYRPPNPTGTHRDAGRSIRMRFIYSITDLTTYESDALAIDLNEREARLFGVRMAQALLTAMPDLTGLGICIAVYDDEGQPISIVPLDPMQ